MLKVESIVENNKVYYKVQGQADKNFVHDIGDKIDYSSRANFKPTFK